MGCVASVVTIIDGINIIRKGFYKLERGSEAAYTYIIGGGLQTFAGLMAFIQAVG
jgi:hypothetical protein